MICAANEAGVIAADPVAYPRLGHRTLIEAAYYWTKVADQWEDVFLEMRNRSHFIAWEGAGGDGCDSEPALTYR